jgi:hypothetical protein
MNVESNIKKEKFACRDVIGVKGLCDTEYVYNLDSLGISLQKAAKLADSSTITGKQLIQESIEFAWMQTMQDLRVDGFMVNGVRKTYSNKFVEATLSEGIYFKTFTRDCDIEAFFFNWINFSVFGTLNIKFSIFKDGIEQVLFNDDVTDENIKINIDNAIYADEIEFKLIAIGDGTLIKTTDNISFQYSGHKSCSEQLFYCKYWEYLVQAVMYKATAVILNANLFTDRYNDINIYQSDKMAHRIAQLDSSYNLLNGENRLASKSLYQQEIETINLKLKRIVKESRCTCCFECDEYIKSKISLP